MSRRFAPLKTIDLAEIGLGDNLMAWSGLYALLSSGLRPTAPACVLYVPHVLAGLAASLFAKYDIRVRGIGPLEPRPQERPLFTSSPPERLADWWRTYAGGDWRMNGFQALDAQKSIPLLDRPPTLRDRVRLGLSERVLYRRQGWQAAVAEYVGYRLWRPLARAMGLLPVPFLTLMKRSLPSLRAEVSGYIDARSPNGEPAIRFAVFPSGKAFQAFTPAACRTIQALLPPGETVFFAQPGDPWMAGYRNAGLALRAFETVEEAFRVIRTAQRLMTTDSFPSHVAQFLRDDFVLALTRDVHENVVHPGAHPAIVANHPACAPCSYVTRDVSPVCSAGHPNCRAFDDPAYPLALAKALLSR